MVTFLRTDEKVVGNVETAMLKVSQQERLMTCLSNIKDGLKKLVSLLGVTSIR